MSETNTPEGGGTASSQETSGNSISNEQELGLNFNNLQFAQGPQTTSTQYSDYMANTGQEQWAADNAFAGAALNQSGWEALGQGLQLAAGEVLGGGIEGIGALFNADVFKDPKNAETNFLESLGRAMREGVEGDAAIYDERAGATMDVFNAKWWAKNLPSLASTAAMFIPGAGAGFAAAKVGSKIGRLASKAGKAGRVLDKAEDLAGTMKAANFGEKLGRTVGGAVAMRHAENMRSVHDVYKQAYDDVANYPGDISVFKGSSAWRAAVEELGHQPDRHELAEFVAGQASLKSYKVNSLNIGFDLLQMGGFAKALRGTRGVRRGLRGAKQRAAAAGKELTKRQRWVARGKGLGFFTKEGITEGMEEGVNFIGENEGRNFAKHILRNEDASTFNNSLEERLKEYTADDHFWESAFLGAIGGMAMQGGSAAFGARKASKNHEAIMEQIAERKAALEGIGAKVKTAYESGTEAEAAAAVRDMVTQEAWNMGRNAAFNGTSDLLEMQLAVFEEQLRDAGHSEQIIEQELESAAQQFAMAEKSTQQAKLVSQALKLDQEVGAELVGQLTSFDFHREQINNERKVINERLQGVEPGNRKKEIAWQYLNDLINREEVDESVIEQLEEIMGGQEAAQAMSEAAVNDTFEKQGAVEEAKKADGKAKAKVEELKAKDSSSMEAPAKRQLKEELAEARKAQEETKKAVKEAEEKAKVPFMQPVGEGKHDDVIADDLNLDIKDGQLTSQRSEFLSDDNLDKLKERVADNKEKKTEAKKKSRKEAKEEAKSEEELNALKRSALSKEEEEEIDEALDELRKKATKNEEQKDLERSKDIEVPGSVQAKVDELLKNSEHVSLYEIPAEEKEALLARRQELKAQRAGIMLPANATQQELQVIEEIAREIEAIDGRLAEENSVYIDNRTGQTYVRTTTWMNQDSTEEGFDPNSPWATPSSNIGNSVDEFTRDFFDGALRSPEAYPHISEEIQAALAQELSALEAQFVSKGEKVIAKDVVLFNDMDVSNLDASASGVAGTVDLLTVDKDGNFRIYDMKTIRNAIEGGRLRAGKKGLDYNRRNKRGKELEQKHQKQLSTYRMMLMNQIGSPVPEIAIIPITVAYPSPEKMTARQREALTADNASYMGELLMHKPLTELHNMSEPDVTENANDDEGGPVPEGPLVRIDENGNVFNEAGEQIGKIVDGEFVPTKEEDNGGEPDPTPDMVLEPGTATVVMPMLLDYFAQQLKVIQQPHRKEMYLVHGANGPVLMDNDKYLEQFELLQGVLSGTDTRPVSIRVEEEGLIVEDTPIYTKLKRGDTAHSILDSSRGGGTNKVYPKSTGDSMRLAIYVGDQKLGELPSTGDIIAAAHLKGRAELKNKPAFMRQAFGTSSRKGDVVQSEDKAFGESTQEEHLENAVAMHALRQQIFKLQKEANESGVDLSIRVDLSTGVTSFGAKAHGSLIYDASGQVTPASVGADAAIRTHGVALVMPNAGSKTMSLQKAGDPDGIAGTPTPYGHLEVRHQEGDGDSLNLSRHESGSLFIPLEQNGDVLWVKAPGMSLSELNNSEGVIEALTDELAFPTIESVSRAQNIMGSRAVVQTEEEGVFAIYAHNISGVPEMEPVSVFRDGEWSVPLSEVLPNQPFDVAASVSEGESAFHTGTRMNIGKLSYESLSDFVAKEIKLGYAPVQKQSENGTTVNVSWTHPLNPAFAYNDSKDGKFANENSFATRVSMTATVVVGGEVVKPVVVSGKDLTKKLVENDPQVPNDETLPDWMSTDMGGGAFRLLSQGVAESSNNSRKSDELDMKLAEEWWAENLPNVPFKRVKGMIKRNGKLGYGIFERGAVAVSDQAVVGTEFHEGFHAVFHMFLSDERRAKVLKDAERLYGKKSDEALEEDLAEDFREYMNTSGLSMKDKSVVRRFFSELMELINALVRDGFSGYRRMQLFQQINNGKFKSQDAKVREYATRNKLIMADVPEYTLDVQKELTQNLKSAMFVGVRLAQRGQGGAKIQQLFARVQELRAQTNREFREETGVEGFSRQDAITKAMVDIGMYAMQVQAQSVIATAPNRAEMIERYTKLFGTNGQVVSDFMQNNPPVRKFITELVSTEFTAGTNQAEQQSDSFEKKNPKDSLSANVKALIETTPMISVELAAASPEISNHLAAARIAMQDNNPAKAQENIDAIQGLVNQNATQTYFGLPQMMNVDRVVPYMSDRLAHLQSPEAMVQELFEMGNVYPEFQLLALRLSKETPDVRAQFFAGFKRGSTAEAVVNSRGYMEIKSPFGGTLANANRVAVQVRIHELAQNAGVTPAEHAKVISKKVEGYLKSGKLKEMSNEQFVTAADNMLSYIGFNTVDPVARRRVLSLKAGDPSFRESIFSAVRQSVMTYGTLAAVDVNNDNAVQKAETSFNRALQVLAAQFNAYDMGAVNSTFQNVEGSQIFSKQVPSFISEWFDFFENLSSDPVEAERQLREEGPFRDERMFATTYGRLLFPKGKDYALEFNNLRKIKSFKLGGLELSQSTYLALNEADWMRILITGVHQQTKMDGHSVNLLPITTPSDGSNTHMVPAMVYNMQSPVGQTAALNHMKQVIRAEIQELRTYPGRFTNVAVNDMLKAELLVKNGDNDTFTVTQTTISEETVDKAARAALNNLFVEAKALALTDAFKDGLKASNARDADPAMVAYKLTVAGYLSNWSTSMAMSGTPNEFKLSVSAMTTDMQKRHKHIVSPGVANAGVTGKQNFRSMTMEESVADLKSIYKDLELSGDYSKVEIADAQSYVSLDFYETILMEHGDWSPEIGAAIEKTRKGEPLSKAEVKLLRPYKPFYYARVFNEQTGMFESQQIKNSIIPIIKGLSPELDKFEAWMEHHGVDQVQMNSAHKVGNKKEKQVSLRDKTTGNFIGEMPAKGTPEYTAYQEKHVYTLPMTGYRKQVNVTDHWHNDSENKLASQLEKIVMSAAVRNMGQRGLEINKQFLDTVDSIYKSQKEKFFSQFEKGKEGFDKEAFKGWLLDQIDDGTTPEATIELVRQGMFTAPSVIGVVRGRIFSSVQNDVNRIMVNGGTQVQVASQFFRTEQNRLKPMRKQVVSGVVADPKLAFNEKLFDQVKNDFVVYEQDADGEYTKRRALTVEDIQEYESPRTEPEGKRFYQVNGKGAEVNTGFIGVMDTASRRMFINFAETRKLSRQYISVNSYAEMMEEINDDEALADPALDNIRLFNEEFFVTGETKEVILPAEIAVSRDSLPAEYRNMSIEEIEAVAPEVLESITLRIPSEAMNSGAVVKIVEFLPEGVDGVVVPDEFVTQMGSDFDVDKLFFQFRANDNSKQDTLFDLMHETFSHPNNLKEIMAPQGFETLKSAAKKNPMRSKESEKQVQTNPLSVTTHAAMRADNMAGVTLKGQAANKNVVLLDLIRNGFSMKTDFKLGYKSAEFDYTTVKYDTIVLFAEMVAAAMDGAKDPVYGKLGINEKNFGFFSELLLMTNGDVDFAVEIIQSRPAQMVANGDLVLVSGNKGTKVIAKTERGMSYLSALAKNGEAKYEEESDSVTLAENPNLFTLPDGAPAKQELLMLSGMGTWRHRVAKGLDFVTKGMRMDKKNVGRQIEEVVAIDMPDGAEFGEFTFPGQKTTISGSQVMELPVKREMLDMFNLTEKTLDRVGDAYLRHKRIYAGDPIGKNMTMQQWDAKRRGMAAEMFTSEAVYTAMGERKTTNPGSIPSEEAAWSLQDHLRTLRATEEASTNQDLSLVLSKLLVQPKPYNVRGTYFDNITLVGIADDSELKMVTDAMERLYLDERYSSFVDAINAYEAQRSMYGTSQQRLTRILPTELQMQIARKAGSHGVTDEVTLVNPADVVVMDVHNPNVPVLGGTLEEAVKKAQSIRKAVVYQTTTGEVIFPDGEETGDDGEPTGNIRWASAPSPNAGQKFAGKAYIKDKRIHPTKKSGGTSTSADGSTVTVSIFDSKLDYSKDSSTDDKISHLKARFRNAGIPVTVEMDNTLDARGRVRIDKGNAKITLHPDLLRGDTVAHEFGHILVEALGNGHPLVQQGIEELRGSELWAQVEEAYPDLSERDLGMEVLVTALGRKGSQLFEERKQQSKFQTIYNRIMRAIGKLFGIQPKATEQLAEMLMFGDNQLTLDQKINTEQYQRRAADLSEAIDLGRKQLVEHLRNLRRRRGSSPEAIEALERAAAVEKRLRSKATDNVKMAILKDATTDVTRMAFEHAAAVRDYVTGNSNIGKPGFTVAETEVLNRAYNLREEMHRLDEAIMSFEGIKGEGAATKKVLDGMKQARTEMREALEELNDITRVAISKKLIAQSTDNTLTEADLQGINVFDLFEYATTKHLAKDSTALEINTLGGAEVRNVVMQLTHKLASGVMDTANFQSKQDAVKIQQVMDKAGVKMSDLMSSDGKHLITEFEVEYYEELEAATRKGVRALAEFHAENTEQAETIEYIKEYRLQHQMGIESRVTELRSRLRNPQLNNATIRKQSKELSEALRDAGADFAKYHDMKVADGFDAAFDAARKLHEDEAARIEAAKETEQDYERDFEALNALNRFVADNQVAMINGKAVPLAGEFAQHTVKEEFKNSEFSGEPKPMAKHLNSEWSSASDSARQALTDMREVIGRATGTNGVQMIERGYVPTYKSHATGGTTEQLKKTAASIREKLKSVTDKTKRDEMLEELKSVEKVIGNEQGVDSQGNPVFTTNNGAWTFAHKNDDFSGFASDEEFKNNFRQFVIDSHKQTGRRSLEAFAYLTRGYLADSKIADGKHKFGKNTEAWKSGRSSNVMRAFDAFMEGTINDNWRDESQFDKAADVLQQYTSLMGVGLNPSAWVNNFAYGAIQNRLVNLGEGVYTRENMKKANRLLSQNSGKILSDLATGKRTKDNKALAMIHTFDIAEDQREAPFNKTETAFQKAMDKAFIGQTYGEIALQNSVMFAMMMDTKVVLADGTETNLYDALVHDAESGLITLPEGATMKSGAQMVELNANSMGAFVNKVRKQNQYTHGAYNKADGGLMQRHWYGRLAMQFRRWLPMGMKTRFGNRHYNEAREREEIGTYRALKDVLAAAAQDASTLKNFVTKLDNLSEEDRYMQQQARRALIEIGIGIGVMAGLTLLAALGGDDDDSWLEAFAKNRAERIGMEMLTYTPIGLLDMKNQMGKDPMAGGARVENLVEMGGFAVGDMMRAAVGREQATYKSGINRGKSKLGVKFNKSLPIIDHYRRLRDVPTNYLAYSKTKEILGS